MSVSEPSAPGYGGGSARPARRAPSPYDGIRDAELMHAVTVLRDQLDTALAETVLWRAAFERACDDHAARLRAVRDDRYGNEHREGNGHPLPGMISVGPGGPRPAGPDPADTVTRTLASADARYAARQQLDAVQRFQVWAESAYPLLREARDRGLPTAAPPPPPVPAPLPIRPAPAPAPRRTAPPPAPQPRYERPAVPPPPPFPRQAPPRQPAPPRQAPPPQAPPPRRPPEDDWPFEIL